MHKSIRTLALFSALSFAAVPSLFANRMGTNPHPQATTVSDPSLLSDMVAVAISYFGA